METQYAIRTEGLSKTYRVPPGQAVHAVSDVHLTVPYGQVFGLLGPNGAGKTTLVRMLSTLLRPTSGRAWVCGYDACADEHALRSCIGYAGQDSERSAHPRLTVRENLTYFAHALHGTPLRVVQQRIDDLSAALGAEQLLDCQFSTLSGGQKQLSIVLRALIHRPQLAFLDEPSKSLDPVTAGRIRHFLVEYAQSNGMTVLLTTHNMGEAEEVCDRLALINRGRLQFVGTPIEFRRSVVIQDVVEVGVSEQSPLALRLRGLPGVARIQGNGTLRLYCDDGLSVLKATLVEMERAGCRAPVRITEPSLEDAFRILVKSGGEVAHA
jgi:ABC-2 type transport system ATP-binding protein